MSAALISAGASLLGGFFNRSATRKANEKNRPENQVREWEQAGINPIFGLSSGSYVPHQASMIGDSFAAAGAQYARSLDLQHEKELRETQIELENERLRLEIDKMSRPSEPGHMKKYGGILPLPFERNLNDRQPDSVLSHDANSVAGFDTGVDTGVGAAPLNDISAIVRAEGAEKSSVLTNRGYVDTLNEFYGDDVADFEGALNFAKDWWYGSVKGDVYYPGWGWRSQITRPKLRPKKFAKRKRIRDHVDPNLNPPLRGYYGKPGSRTGF